MKPSLPTFLIEQMKAVGHGLHFGQKWASFEVYQVKADISMEGKKCFDGPKFVHTHHYHNIIINPLASDVVMNASLH